MFCYFYSESTIELEIETTNIVNLWFSYTERK